MVKKKNVLVSDGSSRKKREEPHILFFEKRGVE